MAAAPPQKPDEAPSFRTAQVDATVRRWLALSVDLQRSDKRATTALGARDLERGIRHGSDPWAHTWRVGLFGQEDAESLADFQAIPQIARVSGPPPLTEEELRDLDLEPELEKLLDVSAHLGDGVVVPWAVMFQLLSSDSLEVPDEAALRFFQAPVEARFGENQVLELHRGVEQSWWYGPGSESPAVVVAWTGDVYPLPQELMPGKPAELPSGFEWSNPTSRAERFRNHPVLWVSSDITADAVEQAWEEAPPGVDRSLRWICPLASESFDPVPLRSLLDGLRRVSWLRLVVDTPEQARQHLSELESSAPRADPFAVALAHLGTRGRAAEAHPAVSDRPRGEDQLDTTPIAQALAWTLALEDTSTPLCVGIFGSWGSGKSFLMRQIGDQLVERETHAPARLRERFVDRVRVVPFNAWTYAKGDLWSAILFEILSALRDQRDLPQAVRLENVVKARQDLSEKREALAAKKSELETARREAERKLSVSETVERVYRHRIDLLEKHVEQARRDLSTVRSQALLTGARVLLPWLEPKEKRRWAPFFMTLAGLALVVGGLVFLPQWQGFEPMVRRVWTWVVVVGGFLAAVTGPLRTAIEVARPAWKRFQEARGKLQEQVELAQSRWQEIEKEVDAVRAQEVATAEARVSDLEGEVRAAERTLHDALVVYGTPVARRDLDEFLDARLGEGDYLERLGPLQQVEQDLKELAVILARQEAKGAARDGEGAESRDETPEGPKGRVVLMIDDLDRCPPDKVVVVLEAIQLLLAENVYLEKAVWPFVVVLGADTRVLTRALESHYEGILSPWESPTGLDYLEKIIQIPYRVPAVQENRYTSYLEKLTGLSLPSAAPAPVDEGAGEPEGESAEVEDEEGHVEPLPPVVWELETDQALLSDADLEILDRFKAIAPDHPRGIKRVLNQYRLAKVLGLTTRRFAPAETAFLLSLAGGFPWVARELVGGLERLEPGDSEAPASVEELLTRIQPGQGSSTKGTGSGRARPIAEELSFLMPRLRRPELRLPSPEELRKVLPDVAPFCFVSGFTERGAL